MEREFERKTKSQSAHSFESKQRTEDVKTGEELSFSDLHISKNVLKGTILETDISISIKFINVKTLI